VLTPAGAPNNLTSSQPTRDGGAALQREGLVVENRSPFTRYARFVLTIWAYLELTRTDLPERYTARLAKSPPKDPLKLYVRLDKDLRTPSSTSEPAYLHPKIDVSRFLDRFSRALDWMHDLHGGEALAFRLWLTLKVYIIHGRWEKIEREARRYAVTLTEQMLEDIIAKINRAPTNVYIRGQRQGTIYINAAGASRQMRRLINTARCILDDGWGGTHCIHDEAALALEILQKHAHREIKSKALRAVRKHLPREIADSIIEKALFEEEVPIDPRVLCDHEHRWKIGLRPQYQCPKGVTYRGYTLR
jgi:hypothetical protein